MYVSVGRMMQNPGLAFRRAETQGFCPECGPLGGNFKLIFFFKNNDIIIILAAMASCTHTFHFGVKEGDQLWSYFPFIPVQESTST